MDPNGSSLRQRTATCCSGNPLLSACASSCGSESMRPGQGRTGLTQCHAWTCGASRLSFSGHVGRSCDNFFPQFCVHAAWLWVEKTYLVARETPWPNHATQVPRPQEEPCLAHLSAEVPSPPKKRNQMLKTRETLRVVFELKWRRAICSLSLVQET